MTTHLLRFHFYHSYYHHSHTRNDLTPAQSMFFCLLPFGLAIIYFVYKFFRNRNRVMAWENGHIPKDFEPTNKNIAEIYIVLASCISKRGKVYLPAKEKLIRNFVKKHFPDVNTAVDESFDHVISNSIDVPEIVFWCNTHFTAEQKLNLFEFIVVVAAVDNDIIPEELELIHYILNKFGIPHDSLSDYAKKAIEIEEPVRPKAARVSAKQRMLRVLGLKDDAGTSEIKSTYRILVKKVHPDRHPNASEQERAILVARFQELQEAYDYLTK